MEKYNMNLKREVKDGVMQIYDNLYPVFTKQASSPVDSKSGNVYLSVILFVCLFVQSPASLLGCSRHPFLIINVRFWMIPSGKLQVVLGDW